MIDAGQDAGTGDFSSTCCRVRGEEVRPGYGVLARSVLHREEFEGSGWDEGSGFGWAVVFLWLGGPAVVIHPPESQWYSSWERNSLMSAFPDGDDDDTMYVGCHSTAVERDIMCWTQPGVLRIS